VHCVERLEAKQFILPDLSVSDTEAPSKAFSSGSHLENWDTSDARYSVEQTYHERLPEHKTRGSSMSCLRLTLQVITQR
jgi:hypothetical protein